MIERVVIVIGALFLTLGLVACGTIEVGLANDEQESAVLSQIDEQTIEVEPSPTPAAPTEPATEAPQDEPTAIPTTETPEATETPAAVQEVPSGWQRFYDDQYGIEMWYPPGTTLRIGELSRPTFSSVEHPEPIVEEQVFVVHVIHDEGGPFGPGGPMAILEVKLVNNPDGKSVGEMADLYSKRCQGPLADPIQPTTINVHLSGYRYACEGIDGIIFNEFWSPYAADSGLIFGAVWANMSAPLSDEILATVAIDR